MNLAREHVLEALSRVLYPGFDRDIVSLGLVRNLTIDEGQVELAIELAQGQSGVAAPLEQAIRQSLSGLDGVTRVQVRFPGRRGTAALPMAGAPRSVASSGGLADELIPQVRHTLAVASGKGGVGKSTVAVNLAVALARSGASTGLLDADIYGPSVPLMTGIDEQPRMDAQRKLIPFERFGVKVMSLGFLVERESAVIWRGPMVMKAIEQLLRDVAWGSLDFLIVDMPPGTGDAQLSLSQRVRLAGAVIVTTPQDVALADARKGVAMFRKVEVPVLGIVENMSFFRCPHCDERSEIFGHGGGRAEAERLGVPCLAELPLDPAVRQGGDDGQPVALGDTPQAQAFAELAARIRSELEGDGAGSEGGSIFDRFRQAWDRGSD